MLYPFIFRPIFKERIWGGRNLERLYQKPLPAGIPIGESWEISDRPGDESIIVNGPLAGKSIRWLMENHRRELLGRAKSAASGRFPLLIKILDAQEKLSLQVHPPAHKAAELHGEPKTEMWFIADATPQAFLYVGLKRGVTREDFQRKLGQGSVAECVQRISVKANDAIFLPSGRVHAIGAGNVIFEVQQNSDTTYRVFDWNRVDATGKPRELHVEQSLASIDFNDFEPALLSGKVVEKDGKKIRPLVHDKLFSVELWEANAGAEINCKLGMMEIIAVLEGKLSVEYDEEKIFLVAGQFCLIPAQSKPCRAVAETKISLLKIQTGL